MNGQSWDPMLEALKRRFEEELLPAVRAQTKRPDKWRWAFRSALFRARSRWMDLLFLAITIVPFVTAVVILAASYPWSSTPGQNYSGVVVTAATATAFGGVLFSLVAAPLQAAAQLAAGYSAELLQRKTLWLTGAWLVSLAIGLFVLGAFRPDREAAIAAGLLTGSSLALVWTAARSLVASSDPQDVARRVASYISRGMRDSRSYMGRFAKEWLPKELRNEPPGILLVRNEERTIVNGFLRHFGAGIEGALAHRQPTSAIVLWDAALQSFIDYAVEVDGDIGDSQGITETLLSMVGNMVQQGLTIPLDDVAVYPVKSLQRLFVLDVGSGSYSAVRSVALIKLKTWIQAGWKDDNTRMPGTALDTVGELVRQSARIGAHEDALHALSTLHEVGAQAVTDKRLHISQPAMQQIVNGLSAFLATDDANLRSYLLDGWVREGRDLTTLRLAEQHVYFMRATEAIFPGITLWGKGLQEVLAEMAPYAHLSSQAIKPMAKWLDRALHDFGGQRESPIHYFAVEALAILYCLALTQAHAVAAGQPPRVDEAERLRDVLLRWVGQLSDGEAPEVLLTPDNAEMVWSCLLALSYTADSVDLLGQAAEAILARMSSRLQMPVPVDDLFSVEFVTGILIASGHSDEEVDLVGARLTESSTWGVPYRGIYIDALGRVPSLNRNRSAIADPQVYDIINLWAAERFPRFVER